MVTCMRRLFHEQLGGNMGKEVGEWVGVAITVQHHVYKAGWCLSTIDGLFGTGISVEKRFHLFSTLDRVLAGYTVMILLYIHTTKQYLNLTIYNM